MYNLGQYIYKESPVHRRDPRVKIITVIALSVNILQANIIGLSAVTLLVLACSQLAGLSSKILLKNIRPFYPFFLCLFVMYILFTPGQPFMAFPIGSIQVSYEGLQIGILQVGKFILLILAASLLTMTTRQSEITMGLERLLRPLKSIGISSHNIATMLSLALRFVPALADEMKNISEAQLARGANFNPNRVSGKIKAIYFLAAPLSVSIFRRCDDLADAMEARGYQPGARTYLRELVFDRTDYCIICIVMVLFIAKLIGDLSNVL
jgi:biotin transport system permease protein/energy-coupling factor transport system permease protein